MVGWEEFRDPPKDMEPPVMVSGTHIIPIRIPKDMGIIWEAYHKGGVPGITLDVGWGGWSWSLVYLGVITLPLFSKGVKKMVSFRFR